MGSGCSTLPKLTHSHGTGMCKVTWLGGKRRQKMQSVLHFKQNWRRSCDLWQLCASRLQRAKILSVLCVRWRSLPLCSHGVLESSCECLRKCVWVKEKPQPQLGPEEPWLSALFVQPEQLSSEEPQKDNLLSVRKPAVGRTHSLPNDSYMFFPVQPFGPASPAPAQLLAQSQGPQHILGTLRAQSGNAGYLFICQTVLVSRLMVAFLIDWHQLRKLQVVSSEVNTCTDICFALVFV